MKAAVLNQFNGIFTIEDIELADPIGREVLLEVEASGLCHSDLHLAQHDFGFPIPGVLGHEVAGVVLALGPGVTSLAVGDHVVGSLIQSCGACAACWDGRTFECLHRDAVLRSPGRPPRLTRRGEPLNQIYGLGGFAERALIHENQLARVPKEVPFAQAAVLGCATVTGAGAAINTAGVRPGDTVAVVGTGGVGLNVISGAIIAGAVRVVAVDIKPAKLDLAKRFGATDTVDASAGDPVAAVRDLVPGGVDHAFEVVGLGKTTEEAIQMTRLGGGIYLIGVHQPEAIFELNVLDDLAFMQRTLHSVFMGSTNLQRDVPMYARLYLQGRLNLDDLVSGQIALDEINDAYKQLVERGDVARYVITSF